MEVLFILILISLGFIFLIAAVLYWSIKSGQYDDVERQGHQILMDDDDTQKTRDSNDDQ
ncbi:MAG: cbb3-type cytochrome oxidase assembly protein CcoS [Gammaproteobacteria bacterium]